MSELKTPGDLLDGTGLEELFHDIVEAVPSGLMILDDRARIAFTNRAITTIFGYEPAELLGQPAELLVPPEFRASHLSWREQFLRDPVLTVLGVDTEVFACRSDGSSFPVEVTLTPLPPPLLRDPELTELFPQAAVAGGRVLASIIDLTERWRVRDELREGEHRLQDLLDNSPSVVYVKDLHGRYMLINRRFESLFGLTREGIRGRTDFEVFPREMAEVFRRNDQHVGETGEVLQTQETAPHADGPHNYFSVKFPLRDTHGRVYAVAGISTDVTDSVRAQEAAETWKHRLELILGSVADGIYGLDPKGCITFMNRAAERLLGWKTDDVLGTTRHHLWNPVVPGSPSDISINQPTEAEFVRRDGSLLPVECVTSALEEQGKPVGHVVTFRDQTERQRRLLMEEELMTARAVQRLLYPSRSPQIAGFDVAGSAYPASLACGDYFDFIPGQDGLLTVATGDVSGHGLAPALQMVETRAFLRAMLATRSSLDTVCRELNQLLLDDLPDDMFVTLFVAQIDTGRRTLQYVGAGHEATLLRASGEVIRLESTGVPLGLLPDADLSASAEFQISAGDVLLIVTDGVAETSNSEQELFGWKRMIDVVQANRTESARGIVDTLYRVIRDYAGTQPQADDVTAMVIKCL